MYVIGFVWFFSDYKFGFLFSIIDLLCWFFTD
ncbi:hypothetical protein E9Y_06599 [Moraxella catarrhalis 101P30B1]|nr:hypothetical protein E9K_04131 [Moraxella catarrhalis 103P14B1]EGE24110.1 hypothetical protein E9Y_06599 [Moraxella catarrhalis 101P30B1]EGE25524.1 hypothetical protein EA1_06308 [Moraxella catarrhalis O35E]